MATTTPNLGLKKPNVTDKVNVSDLNGNADLLDAIIGRLSNLNTTQKDSLVAAINEALTSAGTAAGFGDPVATVDGNTGTPSVKVTASGPDTAKVFTFTFKNLKGAKGAKGDPGTAGKDGTRGRGWYQHGVVASDLQIYSWDGWPTAPKWGEGDWLYDPDNGNVGLCTSRTDNADGSGSASITYKGILKGADGSSIQSIKRTSGTGAPGTTDTYTVTLTNGNTTTFQVYNGKDGSGSGDMTKSVYDPKGKAQDIFAYADAKQSKITASGILKGNGAGSVSAAVKGTDYAVPSVGVSVTLRASGWNANTKTQTVSVSGVTATVNLIITAAPDSYMAYAKAGVRCTAQGAGTLTFACETVPTDNVAANVLIVG